VVFSADNTRLAVSELHGTGRINIWDLTAGKKVRAIACPIGQYTPFDLSPDGNILAAGVGPCIQLWDTASGKRLLQQEAHERPPIALAVSGDGKTIASMDAVAVAHVWEVKTGRQIERLDAPPLRPWKPEEGPPHWYPFEAPLLIFTPQGKVQALGQSQARWSSQDAYSHSMVHQFDLATQKLVRSYAGHKTPIGFFALAADGKTLAGVIGRHIHLWNTASGKERLAIAWREENPKQQANLYGLPRPPLLAFSPDGRTIAGWGFRRAAPEKIAATITLWEVATGKVRGQLEDDLPPTGWAGGGRQGPVSPVFNLEDSSLTLAPDGQTVALGYGDTIRLWDVGQNREIRRFGGSVDGKRVAFSPDGKLLAAAGKDGSIFLWEVATGTRLPSVKTAGRFTCFRFLPDGRTLATGGEDSAVLLWDLAHFATPAGAAPAPADLEALWQDLAGDDGSKAGNAVRTLHRAGAAGVNYLKGKLQPIAPADAEMLRKLCADLDSDTFSVRNKAARALANLGDLALPALRTNDGGKRSLESQRRVDALLEKLEGAGPTPAELRSLRAIEALEHIGSDAARQVLEALAAGAPEHRVTVAAGEASRRLRLRQAP
jgi:WD40 repeat protein